MGTMGLGRVRFWLSLRLVAGGLSGLEHLAAKAHVNTRFQLLRLRLTSTGIKANRIRVTQAESGQHPLPPELRKPTQ